MHRFLLAIFLSALAGSSAQAAPCLVGQWRVTYGEQTSATLTAPAGAICGIYIGNLRPGTVVQSVSIGSAPRNGTAAAYGMGVSYQAKPDFTGQDSFTFRGCGPRQFRPRQGLGARERHCYGGRQGSAHAANARAGARTDQPSGIFSLADRDPRSREGGRGLLYFIRGLVSADRDDDRHRPPQYFLTRLSQAGWDVTYAKYPQDLVYPGQATHGRVAEFLRNRLQHLKRDGYRRVIVGGQSWGAWVTLVAQQQGDLAADGLFLLVPATHGKKMNLLGEPNPSFTKNKSELAPLVTSIRKPVAAVFFADDDYDPGGRGKLVEQQVRTRQLAHLLIDNPPGLKGHGAGWLPMFDFAYGACIETFLGTLTHATVRASNPCQRRFSCDLPQRAGLRA